MKKWYNHNWIDYRSLIIVNKLICIKKVCIKTDNFLQFDGNI